MEFNTEEKSGSGENKAKGRLMGRLYHTRTRFYFSLYAIVPVIFSGLSILSSIVTFQIVQFQNQFGKSNVGPVLVWIAILGAIAGLCGFALIWLLLKPMKHFVEEALKAPALSGNAGPPERAGRDRGDELQQFRLIFKRITDVLSKVDARQMFPEIIGESVAMRGVLHQIMKVAPTDSTVLILGESGTGKELVATSLFEHSRRSDKPFVKINCAAMPADLLESELFGHEKGAFTGAVARKVGKFEIAAGGTLFLDEIGDMPLNLQPKILRVLQEREFDRVGGVRPIRVDVRFIAATNQNLEQMVRDGRFREDLFFRLNVFTVHLPPLRERKEDIPLIVDGLLKKTSRSMRVSAEALQLMMGHGWPGNIRELQNVIERAAVIASEDLITVDYLPEGIARGLSQKILSASTALDKAPASIDDQLREIERGMILQTLKETGGIQARAAERLGINQRSLWHRIKKYEIDVASIKINMK